MVPSALQRFVKHDGKWISAPVNVHSTNWVWANKKIFDELKLGESNIIVIQEKVFCSLPRQERQQFAQIRINKLKFVVRDDPDVKSIYFKGIMSQGKKTLASSFARRVWMI